MLQSIDDIARDQRIAWDAIRAEARDWHRVGRAFVIHAAGALHATHSLDELARVTWPERRWCAPGGREWW